MIVQNLRAAEDKEVIRGGTVYFALPDYPVLIKINRIFFLSFDKKVTMSVRQLMYCLKVPPVRTGRNWRLSY